jgi:hypothetical protein
MGNDTRNIQNSSKFELIIIIMRMEAVPLNNPVPGFISELDLKFHDEVNYMIYKINDQRNKIIEDSLRNFAVPPVKGKITKGKIKWRGIKLIIDGDNCTFYSMHLEQRGEQISPTIVNKFGITDTIYK